MQIEFILSGQCIYSFDLLNILRISMLLLNLINFSSNGTCALRNRVYFHF